MSTVEQVDAGTIVSDYLVGSVGVDRVLMTATGRGRAGTRFTGDFTSWEAGSLAGCDVAGEGPTRASARCRWPSGVHVVGALVDGSAEYTDDTVSRSLLPASVLIYPGDAPFVFDFDDVFRYVVVTVTAQDLGVTKGSMERLARPRVVEPSPFAGALAALIGSSAAWASRTPTATAGLGDEIRSLLQCMARFSDEQYFGVGVHARHAVVLEWIEQHLADPTLDPERIAAAHHISIRQLHRLFAELGITCRRYVLRRRLERVRADLVGTQLSLGEIAMRWGLGDSTYLSKAFKAEYGASPSEARRHASPRDRPNE
ncbi:helix-turn-helix transcriptional regulator [Janibacter terrae]|uniref:helix-turn-helix transcriptional regulator n=1 Tax=Janibacter terrae TaxID=103817 RepID=UPI00082BA689|nr:AraC family transcriptional regulator [Janibacter terrae]MBA4084052.1 AraC family transcriptional regulator [Kytococcus sp.]HBO54934.1 AraC family transcriptional regulator [Janibacter terrae]